MSGEVAPQEANSRTYSHARRVHAKFGQKVGPALAGSRMISPQDRPRPQDHEDLQDNEVVVIEETTTRPPTRWLQNARIQDKTHHIKTKHWKSPTVCDFSPQRGLQPDFLDHEQCKMIFLKILSLRNAGSKIFDREVREQLDIVVKKGSVQGARSITKRQVCSPYTLSSSSPSRTSRDFQEIYAGRPLVSRSNVRGTQFETAGQIKNISPEIQFQLRTASFPARNLLVQTSSFRKYCPSQWHLSSE
ncbi:hypothetical protein BDZ97DRAFT_1751756 [Flammula alnicola]|nr:hypothetical protein BDZ97DRAFT_1751756 [Flammula alnicola]